MTRKKKTEAQIKATKKFDKENYDQLNVQVKKGEIEKIKEVAQETGQSMAKLVKDAVNEKIEAQKGWDELTDMLEAYGRATKIVSRYSHNKTIGDCDFSNANIFPFKTFTTLLLKRMHKINKKDNERIAELLSIVNLDDFSAKFNAPVPLEHRSAWLMGFMTEK